MPTFQYEAMDAKTGLEIKETIDAASQADAEAAGKPYVVRLRIPRLLPTWIAAIAGVAVVAVVSMAEVRDAEQ